MSASRLRSRLNRTSTSHSSGQRSFIRHYESTDDSNANGYDERTTLLGGHVSLPTGNLLSKPQGGLTRLPRRFFGTLWTILKSNYAYALLVFVPLGIISGAMGWPPLWIFALNFLGIIPLATLLSFATEELAATLGPAIGGLLNATFGNAIEFIVCVISLTKDQFRIVQTSLLGSVLVNILLVLGACFVAGGIRRQESKYDPTLAMIMAALQTLAAAALIVPAILYATVRHSDEGSKFNIIELSRGTAVVLLVLYLFYLNFQLRSHTSLFEDSGYNTGESDGNGNDDDGNAQGSGGEADSADESGNTLGPWAALTCLVLTTVCVAFNAEFLVDSIDAVVEQTSLSKTFVGIVLLPIVSNAAEHVTAVIVSWKGKMNLALCVDLGSGLQIALFVTPLLVIIAWIMDKELTLHFHGFETVIFFLSVLVVNFLIQGGRSNYLEGCMCLGWYAIIAVAFFYYPDDTDGTNW